MKNVVFVDARELDWSNAVMTHESILHKHAPPPRCFQECYRSFIIYFLDSRLNMRFKISQLFEQN